MGPPGRGGAGTAGGRGDGTRIGRGPKAAWCTRVFPSGT